MKKSDRGPYVPTALAGFVLLIILLSAIKPHFPSVWVAEIIPVVMVYAGLLLSYRRFQFSHLAYALMSVWLILHSIGAHYTFDNVPWDFYRQLLPEFLQTRNHFDRLAHFSIGFYAFAIAELMRRRYSLNKVLSSLFGLLFIMSLATSHEIIEWIYAVLVGGDAGLEFLGSQGDIWDAQKDMLATPWVPLPVWRWDGECWQWKIMLILRTP